MSLDRELPPGDTLVEAELNVASPRLWELNDPYLYRVTARVSADSSPSFDEHSTRCGFRDFRLENGYFRLNGKRLFLKSSHSGCETPVGGQVALDPDLLRRDLLNCKVMGMNMIRSFNGLAARYQIELCDEIGLMMYQENYASWFMEPSPKMVERFNRSTLAMVKRDRNHPSIVMWGLLNEMPAGPVVEQAIAVLPLVRAIDDTPHGHAQQRRLGRRRQGLRQSGRRPVAGRSGRPASVSAAAAQRGRDQYPADHQRRPKTLSGSPSTAWAAPSIWCG